VTLYPYRIYHIWREAPHLKRAMVGDG